MSAPKKRPLIYRLLRESEKHPTVYLDDRRRKELFAEAAQALSSTQPEVLELPDSEGWWWAYDKNRYGWECRSVSNLAGELQWWGESESAGECHFLECEKGSWIKIPTPEEEPA